MLYCLKACILAAKVLENTFPYFLTHYAVRAVITSESSLVKTYWLKMSVKIHYKEWWKHQSTDPKGTDWIILHFLSHSICLTPTPQWKTLKGCRSPFFATASITFIFMTPPTHTSVQSLISSSGGRQVRHVCQLLITFKMSSLWFNYV